jgi:vitamin B12 transporter
LNYVGKRDDINPNTFGRTEADDYVLLNLSGSYQLTEEVELFARGENLLDEDYQDVLGFQTAGASGYGGVRIRF